MNRRLAVVVSLTPTAADPRVRRQVDALLNGGWSVVSLGYGSAGNFGAWTHVAVPERSIETAPFRRALRVFRLLATRLLPGLSAEVWSAEPRHRALVEESEAITSADLVIANDYNVIPACIGLADRLGCALIYDMHEYSAGEKAEDRRWRLLYPPYIRALERSIISRGAVLSTVSDGIAALVARDYALVEPPTVIRNLPNLTPVEAKRTGDRLLVHYHGVLTPGRGLENLIRSVPLWDDRFSLRLRGPASAVYRDSLGALIASCDVAERVSLLPPVPASDIVTSAADADIGIHMLPGFSDQNRYALPNKLFEYMMAGLAVIVTDLPAMSRVVRSVGAGALVTADTPEAIAEAVNTFTTERVEQCRRAARDASREFCWESEAPRFMDLVDRATMMSKSAR